MHTEEESANKGLAGQFLDSVLKQNFVNNTCINKRTALELDLEVSKHIFP